MKKVGIALSGGGSRGIMHIGVLKAFDEAGIPLNMITGTSAGAIVGAFYCSGYSPDSIMEIIRETKLIKYVRPAFSSSGLLSIEAVGTVFRRYLKNNSFEALRIPLTVAATDVRKAESTLFDSGELIPAVLASCAVPVIFRPVQINGEPYIDGGILNNLPVEPLKDKCELIIGSNCNAISTQYEVGNIRSLIERSLLMAISVNTLEKKQLCRLFLEPEGLKEYGGFDFSKAEEIFEIGYRYAKNVLAENMDLFAE